MTPSSVPISQDMSRAFMDLSRHDTVGLYQGESYTVPESVPAKGLVYA